MSAQIKLRRDTSANWTSVNPILSTGEPGLETDTLKVKYGDGITRWNLLSYPTVTFPSTISNATTATNLSGGSANQLVFQSGTGATSFVAAPSQLGYLQWTGTGFAWTNNTVQASALAGTNLATSVVSSSLTTLGTLTSLTVGGQTNITVGTQSSSTLSGALVVTGGAGVSGNVYIGGNVDISGNEHVGGNTVVTGTVTSAGEIVNGNLTVSGKITLGGVNIKALALALAAAMS